MTHKPIRPSPQPLVCQACRQPFKGGDIAVPFYKVVEAHGVVGAERIPSGIHLRCLLYASSTLLTCTRTELTDNLHEYLDRQEAP